MFSFLVQICRATLFYLTVMSKAISSQLKPGSCLVQLNVALTKVFMCYSKLLGASSALPSCSCQSSRSVSHCSLP